MDNNTIYYKRLRSLIEYLTTNNNFGIKVDQVNEDLYNIGFQLLVDKLNDKNKTNLPANVIMIDMIKKAGLPLTPAETRVYESMADELDNITYDYYALILDKDLYGTDFNIYQLNRLLYHYTLRNKQVTKEQSSKENSILKYLLGSQKLDSYRFEQLVIPDNGIPSEDIQNVVVQDFKTRTVYLLENNQSNTLFLRMPMTKKVFYDTNTQHISAFMYSLLIDFLGYNSPDLFNQVLFGRYSIKLAILLLFLELERRFYEEETIESYLLPVVDLTVILSKGYIVIRKDNSSLFVIYRNAGILEVEEKYVSKVLFDKGVTLDSDGRIVLYTQNNKPLWEVVFPIYKPKASYNIITDSNRTK